MVHRHQSGTGRAKRLWGIGLLVWAAFMLVGAVQSPIDAAAVLLVGIPAVVGGLLCYTGAREAERARVSALQQTVLDLAQEDGRLTVTEVASRLGWTMADAEKVLRSLDDGFRVCTMPSDEGVLVYEFRELVHDPDRPRLDTSAWPAALPADPPPLPADPAPRSRPA